jgi:exodeoxyribonuclease V alpha subunit
MKLKSLTRRGDYLLRNYPTIIQSTDVYAARYLASKSKINQDAFFDLVILLSAALKSNQVSIHKDKIEGRTLPEIFESIFPGNETALLAKTKGQTSTTVQHPINLSDTNSEQLIEFKTIILDSLIETGLIQKINTEDLQSVATVNSPLIIQGDWLYFRRQWVSEWYILKSIQSRLKVDVLVDHEEYEDMVRDLFLNDSGHTTAQIEAVLTANMHPFSIITGGPGTGKTRTIVGFLTSILRFKPELSVLLCAPTGKAASRMVDSIQNAVESDEQLRNFKEIIPQSASTIHRLLGWNPSNGTYKFNEDNPISVDLIIVDEASMIDLVTFSRLMRAVSPTTRMVLLGDKDQLASVEAGSVFGDLIRAGSSGSSSILSEVTTKLTHSWRFKSDSGLGLLSEFINNDEVEASWKMLKSDDKFVTSITGSYSEVVLSSVESTYLGFKEDLVFTNLLESKDVVSSQAEKALGKLSEFQVLTAHRTGQYGAVSINHIIDRMLSKDSSSSWYVGRPIIATENDYDNGVFNGDLGITVEIDGEFWVYFGKVESTGRIRLFKPSQLSNVESAWVLTVHKSQGSEYNHVMLILPNYESPVLSRELLYTAVTRSRESVCVVSNKEIWSYAVRSSLYTEGGFLSRLTSVIY